MKKNMGSIDRVVRIMIAIIAIILYNQGIVTGTLGIMLIIIAGVFTLTSLVSFCPLYRLVGLNTCPLKEGKS